MRAARLQGGQAVDRGDLNKISAQMKATNAQVDHLSGDVNGLTNEVNALKNQQDRTRDTIGTLTSQGQPASGPGSEQEEQVVPRLAPPGAGLRRERFCDHAAPMQAWRGAPRMAELTEGALFAGYRIGPILGRGGMGAVYEATETALDRRVALKVIAADAARDESFREQFERESRVAAKVDDPHVIPIYRVGREGETLFIAMRLVRGLDLGEKLARRRLGSRPRRRG